MNSNVELEFLVKNFPVFCVFHGDGYNEEWAKHTELQNVAFDGTEKADKIRTAKIVGLSREEAEKFMRLQRIKNAAIGSTQGAQQE